MRSSSFKLDEAVRRFEVVSILGSYLIGSEPEHPGHSLTYDFFSRSYEHVGVTAPEAKNATDGDDCNGFGFHIQTLK